MSAGLICILFQELSSERLLCYLFREAEVPYDCA